MFELKEGHIRLQGTRSSNGEAFPISAVQFIAYSNPPTSGPTLSLIGENSLQSLKISFDWDEADALFRGAAAVFDGIQAISPEDRNGREVLRPRIIWKNAGYAPRQDSGWFMWLARLLSPSLVLSVLVAWGLCRSMQAPLTFVLLSIPVTLFLCRGFEWLFDRILAQYRTQFSTLEFKGRVACCSQMLRSQRLAVDECGCLALERHRTDDAGRQLPDLVHWFDRQGVLLATIDAEAFFSAGREGKLENNFPGLVLEGIVGSSYCNTVDIWTTVDAQGMQGRSEVAGPRRGQT